MSSSACRTFEERLAQQLDSASRADLLLDAHAATCEECTLLTEDVWSIAATFRSLAPVEPTAALLSRLARPPEGAEALAVRREAAAVVDLLTQGVLSAPEPGSALLDSLVALSRRPRSTGAVRAPALPEKAAAPARVLRFAPVPDAGEAQETVPAREDRPALSTTRSGFRETTRRLLGDWRFTVALAYAAALLIVAVLKVDPLSVARGTASDLTSAGERAVADAKVAAVKRFNESALGRAALTSRLDYRVYRTLAAGRARAVAYSQLLFEKVIGGSETETASGQTGRRKPRRSPDPPEPPGRTLRS